MDDNIDLATYSLRHEELPLADLVRLLLSPMKVKQEKIKIVFPEQLPENDPFHLWCKSYLYPKRPELKSGNFVACFLYSDKLLLVMAVNSKVEMDNGIKKATFSNNFRSIYYVPELCKTDEDGTITLKFCEIYELFVNQMMKYLIYHLKEAEQKRSSFKFVEEEPYDENIPDVKETNGDFFCEECGEDDVNFFMNEDNQIQCPTCGNIKRN